MGIADAQRMDCALGFRGWLFAALVGGGFACTGDEGPAGPAGDSGDPGETGEPGEPGEPGDDGRNPLVVGAGLELEIQSASISDSGAITTTFRIADSAGRPLDREGLYTEGAVSTSFVAAWLGQTSSGEPLHYTAYTTNSNQQASSDSDGSYAEVGQGDGVYTYTFGTVAEAIEADKTHTIAVYATRNFEGERYIDNATYNWVPNGSDVEVTRDIVTNEACNSCHNPLSAHGGSRRDVQLCITCHSPQTTDPESGNTVDFQVMIHKIHRGANLPSVQAGGSYELIGYMNRPHNYDDVVFPHDIRSCDSCHNGTDGDVWKTRPTRAVCTSCHDTTSFAATVPEGMEPHAAGPMPDDSSCANIGCHQPSGGLAGIVDSHLFPAIDPATPEVVVTIDEVRNTEPGQVPVVDFTVTVNGTGLDIGAQPLNRLRFTVAGPTVEYEDYFQVVAQNNGAASAGSVTARNASAGQFTYTFPIDNPIPDGATGSYAMGIEARYRPASGPDVDVFNPVRYFAVTDTTVQPRRTIVDAAGCNSCHLDLSFHGGGRKNPEYCAFCHNPNNTNDERAARTEETIVAESVDFKRMIHGIHRGEDHARDYILYGFSSITVENPYGRPHNFSHLRFPGDLRDCGTCHVAGSFALPLGDDVLSSAIETFTCNELPGDDGDNYCQDRSSTIEQIPPATSVCTACHDSSSTGAHAELMTTSEGVESCVTCHGPGSSFDMSLYHRLDP